MTWLVQHQEIVTWSLAFLAAATALAAGYVQGWFALRAIRLQLGHADARAQEKEAQDASALLECLAVDLIILERRLTATRMHVEDAIRDPSSTSLSGSDLMISVPDTIAASWGELARLPSPIVAPIRTLSLQLIELRELAAESVLSNDRPAFARAALQRTQRATLTTQNLKADIDLRLPTQPELIGSTAPLRLEKLATTDRVEKAP